MNRKEAIKWLSNLKNDLGQIQYQPLWHYTEAIDGIIEILQTDIVHCKNCKYMKEHYDTNENVPYWTCPEWDSETEADGFCHHGERK